MQWQTPLKSNLTDSNQSSLNAIHDQTKFITVTCRLKPLFSDQEKSKIEIDTKTHSITLNDPTKSISKTYSFDQIFDQTVGQDHFTNTVCQPLVRFLKNGGQSGLIFSYGITNSGKTYTILGTKEKPGILLTLIKKLEQEFKQQTLRIVACELYKDEFFSLKTKGEKYHPKQLRGTFTFDQCHGDIINKSNMQELFSQYLTNRSCSSTSYNTISSRSHAIFKIICGKFRIGVVDLAGSERTGKGSEHVTDIKETIFINSSLLTLKKCIKSLEEKSQLSQKICIPYRQSKLTQSLVEYFVPNSKISIIVNINQARHCLEQNLNVMDYTSKTKNITANVMSDFSQMLKTTARKKQAMILAVKSYKVVKSSNKKNFISGTNGNGDKSTSSNSKAMTMTFGKHAGSIINSSTSKQHQSQQKSLLKQQQHQKQHQKQHHEIQTYEQPFYNTNNNTQLQSIEQQFDQHNKKSQHAPTTICCSTQLACSNILIQEIYQQYHDDQFNNNNKNTYEQQQKKQKQQHKMRYSVQFVGQQHKYIIDEDVIDNQQLQQSLLMEIQEQQRKSFIQKKNIEQTYQQFIENQSSSLSSIEQFIQKQQQFRNYLAFDREFQALEDKKKLSALKKVNLFETTKKKQYPLVNEQKQQHSQQIQQWKQPGIMMINHHHVQTADVSIGTTDNNEFFKQRRTTEQLNDTIENMDFQKLKTAVKRKLLQVLKDDQKIRNVNKMADENQSNKKNYHHESIKKQKTQSLSKNSGENHKFSALKIDQTEVQNQQSNFTTPSKNTRKQTGYHHNCTESLQKQYPTINSQVNQSILKKTFDKVASGVKSGVQFMADKVGLGNHIFRTNNKNVKSLSEKKVKSMSISKKQKLDMKIWNAISQTIEPYNMLHFIPTTSQQVQVTSSIKKVRYTSQQEVQIDYDTEIQYPNLEQKQVEKVVFEASTQTEEMEMKFVLEDVIQEVMEEQKKKKNFKKNKKQVRIEEDNSNSNEVSHYSKKQQIKRQDMKKKEIMQKTAFKCTSVKKEIAHSLKKRPEIMSMTKSIIAHKTRGARKKQDHN